MTLNLALMSMKEDEMTVRLVLEQYVDNLKGSCDFLVRFSPVRIHSMIFV